MDTKIEIISLLKGLMKHVAPVNRFFENKKIEFTSFHFINEYNFLEILYEFISRNLEEI